MIRWLGVGRAHHELRSFWTEFALSQGREPYRGSALAPDYAFGGQEKQRALLEAEGVTFLADGRIDMTLHLWGKYEQFNIFDMS